MRPRIVATLGSGSLASRALSTAIVILSLVPGIALGTDPTTDGAPPVNLGIAANPLAASGFIGSDRLGRALGIPDSSGFNIGGLGIVDGNWLVSGGVKPHSTTSNFLLALHASVDTEKAFGLPGGFFGAEFLEFSGANTNHDAGSVQLYNVTASGPPPLDRQELHQIWWRQKLFNDKLIVKIGKINASGDFNTVLRPVPVSPPNLQDWTVSGLLYTPVGLNPTLFSRLPGYPNTAYGLTVTLAPTNNIYASYGFFDGNQGRFVQTGLQLGPTFNSYKFHIGEIGYAWTLDGKPGLVGAGVWGQTGKLLTPDLTFENGAKGFYGFGHQRLWYQHPGRDPSGLIGFFQYGLTNSHAAEVTQYAGFGLTGIGLIPGRPSDSMGVGLAWSRLNDSPFAGAFFAPDVPSASTAFRKSELMSQIYYEAVLIPWTVVLQTAYTYIPTPGLRPDIPAAHALTARLVALF